MLKLHFYNTRHCAILKNKAFITVASVVCAKHTVPILFKHTSYVLFRTPISKLTTEKQALVLRQNKIEQVECIKFLGVYIQEHLTWSRHINHLISKLCSVLGTVIKVKSLLSKRSLLLLYHL